MNTMNESIMKEQIKKTMQEQYKNHTTEQLLTQIKRYESTSTTFAEKASRNWAQAVNGGEGYHYNVARMCYKSSAENAAKAEALKEMVEVRTRSVKTHGFTGSSKAAPPINGAQFCAATGAIIGGASAGLKSVVDGDCAEEVVAKTATGAVTGSASSASSYVAGSFAANGAAKVVAKTAIGTGAIGTMLPGAVGFGAALVAGEVTARVAKPLVEEIVDGFRYGDPIFGVGYGLERAGEEIVDMVEETVESIVTVVDDVVFGIQSLFWFI